MKDVPSVASAAGFDDPPTYSVFSRAIGEFDDDMLATAAKWARTAAQHQYVPSSVTDPTPNPDRPEFVDKYLKPDQQVGTVEKMETVTRLVAEYMALVKGPLTFDQECGRDAPNFQHPVEEIYRLLAHIALEDCSLENGYRILDWKLGDESTVPSPERIRYYAHGC